MSQLSDLVDGGSPDFRRDRYGRPLIMQTDGKRIPYTRASSATKAIDDTWNLDQWDRRNVSYGMAHDASLVARVLAIGGDPSTWSKADKDAVAKVVDDARTVAKAHKGADIGTAVHRIIERRNRGDDISAGPYQPDVEAYYRAIESAGISILPEFLEVRLVCDELGLAGSADNILGYAGGFRIGDLKTGASVAYGTLSHAGQLAAYAHGDLYDVDQECRLPTPELDQELGFIIHLPAGEGRCDIYEINLAKGYRAAKVAYQARAAQKASKSWLVHHTGFSHAQIAALPASPAGDDTVALPSLPEAGPAALDRATVVTRARRLVEAGHGVRLSMIWPDGVPGLKNGGHSDVELRAIYAAICAVEDEHNLSPGFVAADRTREPVPSWDEQRRRAAIRKARLAWDDYWEPDVMRDLLEGVMRSTIVTIEHAFQVLTIDEADRLAEMADRLNDGHGLEHDGTRWAVTPPKEHAQP